MKALEKMMGIPLNIQKPATKGRNGATFIPPNFLYACVSGWVSASRCGVT